jgi:integrase
MREHLNPAYRSICDSVLDSHMRGTEFRWFMAHPQAYKASRRCISLTKEATKKVQIVRKERDIILTIRGCEAIENFIRNRYYVATRSGVREALILAATKAGIGTEGITPKMFRKTYLSWLVVTHPELYFKIAMSAGHTVDVLQNHYAGIAFQREDVTAMREYVKGWGSE